jgi:CheY-like chemotaxis protein
MASDHWPDLKGVHVLVIDDNDDSWRLLEQALNDCGALVTVFSSAEAVLEAMNEYLPSLIICDLSMPGMTRP